MHWIGTETKRFGPVRSHVTGFGELSSRRIGMSD